MLRVGRIMNQPFCSFSEEEVLTAEKAKWLVHDCDDGFVCFESVECDPKQGMQFRNRYLEARYPSGGSDGVETLVMLEKDYYPQGEVAARWKVECEASDMQKCTLRPERWSDMYMCTQYTSAPKDGVDGLYITCCKEMDVVYFRVYAPPPSDRQVTIYKGTNDGNVTTDPYKKEITIGMECTSSHTETISESTSMEVGGSFKAFSGGVSQSVSKEWSTTTSSTYTASVKTTYTFTIPPRTEMIVTQLLGSYGNVFDVHSENYNYHYTDLDTGVKTVKKKRAFLNEKQECEMKEEL